MKGKMTKILLLILLFCLFLAEFLVSLFAHALVLRFDTCHTLILSIITLALIYKRKKSEQFEKERFVTFWLTVAYVAMAALCVVHVIYSLQMLSLIIHMHFHEMDIHYPTLIMSLGAISLLIKFFCVFYIDSGFADSRSGQVSKAIFHFIPPLTVLVVSMYRVAKVVVWFDPVLNAFCNIITLACLYAPGEKVCPFHGSVPIISGLALQNDMWFTFCSTCFKWLNIVTSASTLAYTGALISTVKENILILLLAVPKTVNIERMKDCFDSEFNQIRCKDLTVWRDSKSRINVSVHVAVDKFVNYSDTCSKMEKFFQFHGAHRVCIEPQFVSIK